MHEATSLTWSNDAPTRACAPHKRAMTPHDRAHCDCRTDVTDSCEHRIVGGLVERIRVLGERLLAIRVVENSVILAAQTFLALFPLMILSYALLPSGLAYGLADAL